MPMRGDSIRDLYAKSLALLGLGMLGAVGAAVDYWPADLAAPAATALDLSAAAPGRLSERSLVSDPMVATTRASIVVTAHAPSAVAMVPASLETVSLAAPEPAVESQPAVELPALVPAAFTGIDSGAANAVELSTIDLPPTFALTTVAPAQVASVSHPGLLSGIGSGIVDGTAKAGSAVVDGLKTVGGALGGAMNSLRRHFPFFSSGPKVGLPASSGLQ